MEADSHNSVCIVKCFLHSIPVMNINVQVQHTREHFQQLKYANYNVVYVAKTTRLGFAGMMVTSSPVNHHIRHSRYYYISRIEAASCC